MAYDILLADRIRTYLYTLPQLQVDEKEMFRGLVFLVNGKMCVNVSEDNLMCRFDAALFEEVASRKGFRPMIMKGKELQGYCYVTPEGFASKKDFEYWITLCLQFNDRAKASKKKQKASPPVQRNKK